MYAYVCICIAMYCLGLGIFGVCGPSFGLLVQHPYIGQWGRPGGRGGIISGGDFCLKGLKLGAFGCRACMILDSVKLGFFRVDRVCTEVMRTCTGL